MEPDPSSRAAARRIVEEVLAEHAARAAPLDGVTPVTVVERPDSPAWRAARRIVEETLAEHAARAVIPPRIRVEVVVDLEEPDVEVLVDLDEPRPSSDQRLGPDTAEDGPEATVVSVVAPIARDETPARSARRIVQAVLDDHGVDPASASTRPGAPMAFEIDPVPGSLPEPTGASPDEGTAEVVTEPGQPTEPDPTEPEPTEVVAEPDPTEPDPTEPDPAEPESTVDGASPEAAGEPMAEDAAGAVVPIDDARLRAAIPDRLFAPDPDPEEADAAIDGSTEGPAPAASPSNEEDPPPPPVTAAPGPPSLADPDAPATIASRIVAEVLAERAQAALDARDLEPDADVAPEPDVAPDPDVAPEPAVAATETLVLDAGTGAQRVPTASAPSEAPVPEPDWGSDDPDVDPDADAAEELDERPPGALDGRVPVMNTPDGTHPGPSTGLLTVEAAPEDELWADGSSGAIVTEDDLVVEEDLFVEDEYGQWPDPIVPPRRTGRWLITTVLGAVSLAFLLPLAIGALRDLVSFS